MQPKRPLKKRKDRFNVGIAGTGKGIYFCNECPFLSITKEKIQCQPNDFIFKEITDLEKIPIPDWCGNSAKKKKPCI